MSIEYIMLCVLGFVVFFLVVFILFGLWFIKCVVRVVERELDEDFNSNCRHEN
jgi:Na+-transporting methylmalonyl-CoA/oxaloacetate decarboxylase gamma subunit